MQILEYLHMHLKIFLESKHKIYLHFTYTLYTKTEYNFVHKIKFHRIFHLWHDIHIQTSVFPSIYDFRFFTLKKYFLLWKVVIYGVPVYRDLL